MLSEDAEMDSLLKERNAVDSSRSLASSIIEYVHLTFWSDIEYRVYVFHSLDKLLQQRHRFKINVTVLCRPIQK
jgi:hypothetical protein